MVNQICKTISDYPLANGSMAFWFSIRDCVPYAFEGLLIGIFLVLFFGNYYLIKSKTGKAKILISLLSSSIVLVILSSLLALSQLIHYITVIFWAFLAIVAFILFLVSDNT
jgi:hypothetical protein